MVERPYRLVCDCCCRRSPPRDGEPEAVKEAERLGWVGRVLFYGTTHFCGRECLEKFEADCGKSET